MRRANREMWSHSGPLLQQAPRQQNTQGAIAVTVLRKAEASLARSALVVPVAAAGVEQHQSVREEQHRGAATQAKPPPPRETTSHRLLPRHPLDRVSVSKQKRGQTVQRVLQRILPPLTPPTHPTPLTPPTPPPLPLLLPLHPLSRLHLASRADARVNLQAAAIAARR